MQLIIHKIGHVRRNLFQETANDILWQAEGAHQDAALNCVKQTHNRGIARQLTIELEMPQPLMDRRQGSDEHIPVDLADDGIFSVARLHKETSHSGTIRPQILTQTEVSLVHKNLAGGIPNRARAGHKRGKCAVEQIVTVTPTRVQARLSYARLRGNLGQIETSPSRLSIEIQGSAKHALLQLGITRTPRLWRVKDCRLCHRARAFHEGGHISPS